MTQEDKELLLKDLSVRLPYGVRGKVKADGVDTSKHDMDGFPLEITFDVDVELLRIDTGNDEIFVSTFDDNEDLGNYIEECQIDGTPWTIEEFAPYLRPMSSMTEEEYKSVSWEGCSHTYNYSSKSGFQFVEIKTFTLNILDWFNAHHFDYRDLIPKGLAIAVDENNNPYDI